MGGKAGPSAVSMRDILNSGGRFFSREETSSLINKAQVGDREAAGRLLMGNVFLVRAVIRKYAKGAEACGLDMDDLFGEAAAVFLETVKKFDVSRGASLQAYIVPLIRHRISDVLNITAASMPYESKKVARWVGRERAGREVTAEDIMERQPMTKMRALSILDAAKTPEKMERMASNGHPYGELLRSENPGPEELYIQKEMRMAVREAVSSLPWKGCFVITRRFGLDGDPGSTLQEVAEMLGMSKSGTYYIQKVSLRELKKLLKGYGFREAA